MMANWNATQLGRARLAVKVAKELGVDPFDALAGVVAESNLTPAVRWGPSRLEQTKRAEDAVAANDRGTLLDVLDILRGEGVGCDISFGLLQRSICLSDDGKSWNEALPLSEVLARRARHLDDEHSLRVGLATYKAWRAQAADGLAAWYLYNWPAGKGAPKSPETAANYQRGYSEVPALLDAIADQPPPPPDEPGEPGPWPDQDSVSDLWQAFRRDIAFHGEFGIPSHWAANYRQLGPPVGPERSCGQDCVTQAFAGGIIKWTPREVKVCPKLPC